MPSKKNDILCRIKKGALNGLNGLNSTKIQWTIVDFCYKMQINLSHKVARPRVLIKP